MNGNAKSYAYLIGAGVVGVLVLAVFFRKQVTALVGGAVDVASGVITGDNAVTRGTVYQGTGIAGTAGAAANAATGGLLEKLGSWAGGFAFDLLHEEYDPNNPKTASSVRLATKYAPVRPEDKPTVYLR